MDRGNNFIFSRQLLVVVVQRNRQVICDGVVHSCRYAKDTFLDHSRLLFREVGRLLEHARINTATFGSFQLNSLPFGFNLFEQDRVYDKEGNDADAAADAKRIGHAFIDRHSVQFQELRAFVDDEEDVDNDGYHRHDREQVSRKVVGVRLSQHQSSDSQKQDKRKSARNNRREQPRAHNRGNTFNVRKFVNFL